MTNYIGRITQHDLDMANKIAERTGTTPAKVLNDFNAFLGQVYAQQEEDEDCDQTHTRHAVTKIENVSPLVQNTQYQKKKGQVAKMLTLNYTIEKDGITLSEINKLMLSERQINDLMDSLVAHGYDVLEMSVRQSILATRRKDKK